MLHDSSTGLDRVKAKTVKLALMNPGHREMSAVCWGCPGVECGLQRGRSSFLWTRCCWNWDEDGGGSRAGTCHTCLEETSVCSLQATD